MTVAVVDDLTLDHALVIQTVSAAAVAVAVVVVVTVLPLIAPLALVLDLSGAVLAGLADAVREVHKTDNLLLFRALVIYRQHVEKVSVNLREPKSR